MALGIIDFFALLEILQRFHLEVFDTQARIVGASGDGRGYSQLW